jgi:hypothetical protein
MIMDPFPAVRYKPKDSVAVGFQRLFLGLHDATIPRRPAKIVDLQDLHEIFKQRDTF